MKILDASRNQRASVCTRLCLLTVIVFGAPLAHAAVIEAWVQRYNGPSDDEDYASANGTQISITIPANVDRKFFRLKSL